MLSLSSQKALDAADNLYIMGQRTGFAASTLSALTIPLKQNGSSVEDFANAMKFMSRNIETATPQAVQAFTDLGLSVTKLRAMTPEEQFYAIGDALGKVTDQGKLTADAMAIFGRGAQGLIPLLKDADGNLERFITTAKKLSDEDIQRIHEYDDAWILSLNT